MSTDLPLVSIGMPLYNAEKYIRLALDSLLAQDYPNFELIISDNGSTDSTATICEAYAAHDNRIRFHHNSENRGAAWNFKHVFDLSNGPYFMWAAHDDLWDANYVTECAKGLDNHPDVVLSCSAIRFLDADGRTLPRVHPNLESRGLSVGDRVRTLMNQEAWFAIYGLIRSATLRKTHLGITAWGSDVILLLELLLYGESMRTDATTFHYRIIPKSVHDSLLDVDPNRMDVSPQSPHWDLVINLARAVSQSDLSPISKIRAQCAVLSGALVSSHYLRSILKQELPTQYFSGPGDGNRFRVLGTAAATVWLNPELITNRGVWSLLARRLGFRSSRSSKPIDDPLG